MDDREFREQIQFWNDYYDDSISDDEFIMHYGIKRRSGRYPWGSGKDPYQRTEDFVARIDSLKKSGMTEKDIATAFGLTTTELRIQQSMAKAELRAIEVDRAVSLRDKGYSLKAIATEMGYANDSSIRSLLNESTAQKMNKAAEIADLLKKHVDEKGMIDVGAGIELELGVSKEKLNEALYMLKMEGYDTFGGGVAQVTNAGKQTNLRVLCPPGTEHKEIYNYENVHTIKDYDTLTGDMTVSKFEYPASVDMSRIHIRYAEDGGVDRDGTIELRRGVPDLDLGGSHYSQVRILTNGTHYLKGMAVYKNDADFPEGCDIIFNTNKAKGTPPEKVFKAIKTDDPKNPFGSTISANGQSYYIDPKTGQKKLSAINKRADEGEWNDWSLGLPSQFLGKQNLSLIKRQLGLAKADKMAELDEIMNVNNPVVRKKLLSDFAEDADTAAADLKAAALPRQRYQVILPATSLKDNEIYAPNFKDGETVCLVRFPHGGTFEIPTLTVNNKNKESIDMLGKNPKDAVCINSKVAERLSGADFDGDTALVIPINSKVKIKTQSPLKGLEGFDNKKEYPARPGMKVLTEKSKGREMGIISNLITDMTLKGASPEELARAVKHSMVVIDAPKHKLDYKKSESDNCIAALKKKYQSNVDENSDESHGAATLLSRAKSPTMIEKRVGTAKINDKSKEWYDPSLPEGALIYNKVKNVKGSKDYDPSQPEGAYITRKPQTYTNKSGKEVVRLEKEKRMKTVTDARTLSSGTPQEELYADYANSMKALANEARKAILSTPKMKRSPEAVKTYSQEVASLKAKLNNALLNAPKERQAQLLANDIVNKMVASNPDMDKDQIKKKKQQALTEARIKFGAKRNTIDITDNEWEAIQKGAVSENVLERILQNADIDSLRSKATPRNNSTLSNAKLNKLQAMTASGYTNAEIAEALGVSASTVSKYM